ncbi:hypothetical protein D3C84_271380 [compost metagenome]
MFGFVDTTLHFTQGNAVVFKVTAIGQEPVTEQPADNVVIVARSIVVDTTVPLYKARQLTLEFSVAYHRTGLLGCFLQHRTVDDLAQLGVGGEAEVLPVGPVVVSVTDVFMVTLAVFRRRILGIHECRVDTFGRVDLGSRQGKQQGVQDTDPGGFGFRYHGEFREPNEDLAHPHGKGREVRVVDRPCTYHFECTVVDNDASDVVSTHGVGGIHAHGEFAIENALLHLPFRDVPPDGIVLLLVDLQVHRFGHRRMDLTQGVFGQRVTGVTRGPFVEVISTNVVTGLTGFSDLLP